MGYELSANDVGPFRRSIQTNSPFYAAPLSPDSTVVLIYRYLAASKQMGSGNKPRWPLLKQG